MSEILGAAAEEKSSSTGLCVSAPADELHGAEMEPEGAMNMEELIFVPSAVSEPSWAVHRCDKKCRAKSFKFFEIVSEERRRSALD